MNYLNAQYSWRTFFALSLLLLAVYLLLRLVHRILKRIRFLGRFQDPVLLFVDKLYRLYLPIILVYLVTIFILVKPKLHGLLALLALILGYRHLKSYFSGVLLRFQQKLIKGRNIDTGSLHGVISDLGMFGLEINTSMGVHFQPYDELIRNGYTIARGDQIGRLLQLSLMPLQDINEPKFNHQKKLFHLFAASPFLDKQHRPEISQPNTNEAEIKVEVLLKEERHLTDLIQVISEWGYACDVKNY